MPFPRIYFDLDGVLADFVGGALAIHGKQLDPNEVEWDFASQIGFKDDQAAFWRPLGFEFWDSLLTLPDGIALFSLIEQARSHSRLSFLSSPCETFGCCDGKRSWVRRFFPKYYRKLFLGSDKSEHADYCSILVDDHDENCDSFRRAGGFSFLVPRPWNSKRAQCRDGRFESHAVFEEFMDSYYSMRGC